MYLYVARSAPVKIACIKQPHAFQNDQRLALYPDDEAETQAVTATQVDALIRQTYKDGRLHIERLSGQYLPLERCYVNLGIVRHSRDGDTRLANGESDYDRASERSSPFSLAARLNVETPPKSEQLSLNTLFEPRQQKNGIRSRPHRILIWGRAGMGKTTLCKKIVHEVYEKGLWKDFYDRVIWLPLRKLRRSTSQNVVELLEDEFLCKGFGERIPEILYTLVQDKRTLFLLDGLDEVSFSLEQDSSQERILHQLLSRSHVIITSRPHSNHELDRQKLDLELETIGFSPQQVDEYLQQMANTIDTVDRIAEIQSFIQCRPVVQSLAAIPIQLDAICYTWNANNFPREDATLSSLYLAISKSLWKDSALRLRKTCRGGNLITKQQLSHWTWRYFEDFVQDEITFLQELAFRGLCGEVIEFGLEDIEELKSSQRISGDELVHLAFLRTSDSSIKSADKTFHFIHLTFQEFFAAQYFVRYWTSNEMMPYLEITRYGRLPSQSMQFITPQHFVRTRKYVDRYDIFWRFVVGLLHIEHDKETFHQLLDTLEEKPIDLIGIAHQRLALHCLSEINASDGGLRHRVRQLEDRYLQYARCQYKLCRTLFFGHSRPKSLIWETECSDYILEQLLQTEETEHEVLEAFCQNWPTVSLRALSAVLQRWRGRSEPVINALIARVFGQHCSHDPLFERFMQRSKTELFQVIDAWTETSKLREPAIKALLKLLRNPNNDIKWVAARALEAQTTLPHMAIETLLRLLRDRQSNIWQYAAHAFGTQTAFPDTASEILVQSLQDPDYGLRRETVRTLTRQATLSDTACEILVELLRDSSWEVSYHAGAALERQANLPGTVVDKLIRLLRNPDWGVPRHAARILGKQAVLPDMAIATFVEQLRDPGIWARRDAVEALRRQTTLPDTAIDTLHRLLQDSDWEMRRNAAVALRRQIALPHTVIETLVRLVQDTETEVRRSASETLSEQAHLPDAVIEALVLLLQGPDMKVRQNAADILKTSASTLPDTAIDTLIQSLQNVRWDIRRDAAIVLKTLSAFLSDTAIEALVELLQDVDLEVRRSAVHALNATLTPLPDVAVQKVVPLLQDSDKTVRHMALHILGRQTTLPEPAIDILVQLLQDPDGWFRQGAAHALNRQTTLPDTATKSLIQLIQDPSQPAYEESMTLATSHHKIWGHTTTLDASVLRHFVERWLMKGVDACVFEDSHLCVDSLGHFQRVPLQQHEIKQFETEWQKARDLVGLPSLTPILSYCRIRET